MTDYYQLLQVDRNASDEVIRAAYRALMQQGRLHPDLGGDPSVAAILNQAYATLSSRDERAAYDAATTADDAHLFEPVNQPSSPIAVRVTRSKLDRSYECQCQACGARHRLAMRTPAELARHRAIKCALCAAPIPLQPAEPRDRKRYDTQIPATVQLFAPRSRVSARIIDLSDRGARIITFAPLAPGQTLRITCDQFDATAVVQWQRRNLVSLKQVYEVGIHFTAFQAAGAPALFQTVA